MEPIRYGFTTKDGQRARIDLTQVRSILPSGFRTGYVKLVLDGGHHVTVAGEAEGLNDLIASYTRHPNANAPSIAPQLPPPSHGLSLFRDTKFRDVYAAKDAESVLPMVETHRGWELDAAAIETVPDDAMLKHHDTGETKPAREWLAGVANPGVVVPGSK